jgi:hypothetical protein
MELVKYDPITKKQRPMAVLVMMAGRSLLMPLKRAEGARRQRSIL